MNRIVSQSLGFCLLTSFSMSALALNPVDGNYGGIFIGVSDSSGSSFTLPQPVTFTGPNTTVSFQSGSIARSVLGAVGGELGYRFCTNYRLEVEAFYNNNHFKSLTINDLTVTSPFITPPITNASVTYNNVENTADPHIQGDTNTGSAMVNAFYDFFIPSQDGYSVVVPFVGIGIGYAYVQNALQFYRVQVGTAETNDSREIFEVWQTRSTLAGQAIAGLSYFMDDFTWFSLDFRYWATKSDTPTSKYTVITPTELTTVNSTVNLFGKNTQLMSINLSFNGVFNLA